MDKLSQKRFNEIVIKEPQELKEESIRFLFGRRSYMTKDQLEKFAGAFKKTEVGNRKKAGVKEEKA